MRSTRYLSAAGVLTGLLASTVPMAAAQDGGGATFTVAQDGSGSHDTISAAIEAATDGDTILIAPGTYPESFKVDKDISLSGDGDRTDVIVAPGAADLQAVYMPGGDIDIGVLFEEAVASVEHLSIQQSHPEAALVWVVGGAVDFTDVAFAGTEVALFGGEPTFTDVSIDAYFGVRDGASPTVVGSEFRGHASVDGPGHTIIRESTLYAGSSASAGATGAYEDNHFLDVPLEVDSRSDVLVQGNLLEGIAHMPAILVHQPDTSARVVGNTIRDSQIGITIDTDAPGSSVEDNAISEVRVGIHVDSASPVVITGNTIEAARNAGIVLQGDGPSVADNRICGSGMAIDIRDGSPAIFSNDICAELEP